MANNIENNSCRGTIVDLDYFGKSFTEDDVQKTLETYSEKISESGNATAEFGFDTKTHNNCFNESVITFKAVYSVGGEQKNIREMYSYVAGQSLGIATMNFITRFSDRLGIVIPKS